MKRQFLRNIARPLTGFVKPKPIQDYSSLTSFAPRTATFETKPFTRSVKSGLSPIRFFNSTSTLAQQYTAQVSARMNDLKKLFQFRNNINQSQLKGVDLVKESELFCRLIIACSTQNGLTKAQSDLCIPYVRIYSGAPTDGSGDNSSTKAQIDVITKEYKTKKATLKDIESINRDIDKLIKGYQERAILKRSALYIAVQLISLNNSFSKADKEWIESAAKTLQISEKEENALTALSILDHKYTPFGPKPVLSKDVYEKIIDELNDINQQMNSIYESSKNTLS